jgi:hypothetical protein
MERPCQSPADGAMLNNDGTLDKWSPMIRGLDLSWEDYPLPLAAESSRGKDEHLHALSSISRRNWVSRHYVAGRASGLNTARTESKLERPLSDFRILSGAL